jgi:hypothetical protein
VEELIEAIRRWAGQSESATYQEALARITEQQGVVAGFLADLPLEEAGMAAEPGQRRFKTYSIVLLFSLGHPAFPWIPTFIR